MTSAPVRKNRPLRVLFVVGNSVVGGAENHALTLLQSLEEAGHKVAVVCPRPGPLVDALHRSGVEHHLIEMVRPAADDEYEILLPALWSLHSLIQRWRPDVVHSHLYPAHLHASLAAQLAGVPAVVTTAHTIVVRPGDSWLARMTNVRIIAVSRAAKSLLVRAGVPAARLRVIYNGIQPQYLKDQSDDARRVRQELGIPEEAPVIGIVARLSFEKGHDEFIRMASEIAAVRPHTRFLIVGTGPLAADLENMVASLGLSERIIFTGARQDIPVLDSAMDIFALPSRQEALPLAVLEAMAAKRPVVATAVGGVPEVVVDKETGLLLQPGDRKGFVQALLRLIDHPELRGQLGLQGRRTVCRRFTSKRMAEETLRYYRSTARRFIQAGSPGAQPGTAEAVRG